jgi:hypothetical protein
VAKKVLQKMAKKRISNYFWDHFPTKVAKNVGEEGGKEEGEEYTSSWVQNKKQQGIGSGSTLFLEAGSRSAISRNSVAFEARFWSRRRSKWRRGGPLKVCGHHLHEDPDPTLEKSWIRIRIKVKSWIRTRIQVMRIQKPEIKVLRT